MAASLNRYIHRDEDEPRTFSLINGLRPFRWGTNSIRVPLFPSHTAQNLPLIASAMVRPYEVGLMSPLTEKYSHRPNDDGTYDSICRTCVRTVARGLREAKLAEAEALHNCPGFRPDWLSESNKTPRKSKYPELLALCGIGRD